MYEEDREEKISGGHWGGGSNLEMDLGVGASPRRHIDQLEKQGSTRLQTPDSIPGSLPELLQRGLSGPGLINGLKHIAGPFPPRENGQSRPDDLHRLPSVRCAETGHNAAVGRPPDFRACPYRGLTNRCRRVCAAATTPNIAAATRDRRLCDLPQRRGSRLGAFPRCPCPRNHPGRATGGCLCGASPGGLRRHPRVRARGARPGAAAAIRRHARADSAGLRRRRGRRARLSRAQGLGRPPRAGGGAARGWRRRRPRRGVRFSRRLFRCPPRSPVASDRLPAGSSDGPASEGGAAGGRGGRARQGG